MIEIQEDLFNILLLDRTTRKNICWATDYYTSYGESYLPQKPITRDLVTGRNSNIVKSRNLRSDNEKNKRTKEKAEVFTPSWVCNEQNNLIDDEWFGRKNVFNISNGDTWLVVNDKINFPERKTWKDYVDARRLEISCGEAPYIVSMYDSVTGVEIPIEKRIGLLDRKLRVINENTEDEEEWFFWVRRAYESVYGYEYQGDNILIARKNLLYTFVEYMKYKFSKNPTNTQLNIIARIISWNIWQMDGITMTVPFSNSQKLEVQINFFDSIDENLSCELEPILCKIFDWRSNCSLEFKSMINGGK